MYVLVDNKFEKTVLALLRKDSLYLLGYKYIGRRGKKEIQYIKEEETVSTIYPIQVCRCSPFSLKGTVKQHIFSLKSGPNVCINL